MRGIFGFLFKTCLLLFLLGGTCLVIGQLAGILFQKGDWVIRSWDLFANPTFILSAIAGMFGFILGYYPKETKNEEEAYSDELREELKHAH